MAHVIAPNYGEQFLFPPALEDWVPADHPARFLREFVDQLDLPALGFVIPAAVQGRPPYAPGLLLKIWLYGYFNRIRSTRKLEAACNEHLSLVWLTGMIAPDHNSLWRFWRDNKKALRTVFKQTVQVAVRAGCVGMALQALDGTKIQAAASGYSGWNKEYMEKLLAALDSVLDQTELTIFKENADVDTTTCRLPAGLAERKALRDEIKSGLAQLAADQRQHYHPAEPEARRMKVSGANRYAYNAQAVADEKEGIIVACENTRQENDHGQLVSMIEQARENIGVAAQNVTTLGDTGYAAGADLQSAQEKGMAVLAPPVYPGEDKPYATQRFHFDAASKTVTCPRGVQLHYQGDTTKYGMRVERYRCRCRDCPVRSECTKDVKGRQIEVWPHTSVVQDMRKRLNDPATWRTWRRRGQIIELRFAHLKQHDGFRRWTVWGFEAVKTQWSLLCATLNLRILYRRWRTSQGSSGRTTVAALKAVLQIQTLRSSHFSLSALACTRKLHLPAKFFYPQLALLYLRGKTF